MKRLNKNRNKKVALAVAIFGVLAVLFGGGLWAYALNHSAVNFEKSVAVGTATVDIIDDSDEGFGKKEVSFVNNAENTHSVALRIAYSETWKDADGLIVSNVVDGENVVAKEWTEAFLNDFTDGGDGWYYYKKVLAPGESVKVLSAISLENESYAENHYDLRFRYEAIQPSAEVAKELWGKEPTWQ